MNRNLRPWKALLLKSIIDRQNNVKIAYCTVIYVKTRQRYVLKWPISPKNDFAARVNTHFL